MEMKEISNLLKKEIKQKCYIDIAGFLNSHNLEELKTKDLIKVIEKSHDNKLLIDTNEEVIYSYELVYTYCKQKLFTYLINQNELDLESEDFKNFKPHDLIHIFAKINLELLDYLIEQI
jgi:hypothetical protein